MGYSITAAARLYGVTPSTVARHLPPSRARRGQHAQLSREEVLDLAASLRVDQTGVREQLDALEQMDPALPEEVRHWARVGRERSIHHFVVERRARAPQAVEDLGAPELPDTFMADDPALPTTPMVADELDTWAQFPDE